MFRWLRSVTTETRPRYFPAVTPVTILREGVGPTLARRCGITARSNRWVDDKREYDREEAPLPLLPINARLSLSLSRSMPPDLREIFFLLQNKETQDKFKIVLAPVISEPMLS